MLGLDGSHPRFSATLDFKVHSVPGLSGDKIPEDSRHSVTKNLVLKQKELAPSVFPVQKHVSFNQPVGNQLFDMKVYTYTDPVDNEPMEVCLMTEEMLLTTLSEVHKNENYWFKIMENYIRHAGFDKDTKMFLVAKKHIKVTNSTQITSKI